MTHIIGIMNTIASYPNLLTSYISYFLENEEVLKAKKQLNGQTSGSVYFSIPIADEIKDLLKASTGLDLSSVASVPMRWIKGDTLPHIDRGTQDFTNTYLAYLTDSSGQLLLGDDSYSIEAGSAFVFNEGIRHETLGTGAEPRLLLGPMSESGFAVGVPTTINQPGGSIIYIREVTGNFQYSVNDINFSTPSGITFPCTIRNNNTGAGFLKVIFTTDLNFATTTNEHFVVNSDYIQFGNESLNANGTRPIITITVSNYDGLIENGSFSSDAFSNVTICNLIIDGTGGSQQIGAGWFGHKSFGKNATNNYIINCSSSGDIYGGGILGQITENVTLIGCSSSGDILQANAGGIVGADTRLVIVQSCWSTGNMAAGALGDGCGGIVGAYCINATITNCYYTGTISGDNSGGIIGSNSGSILISISNCYSTGVITGANAGGICGSLNGGTYNVTIANCYTVGNLINSLGKLNGAICGYISGAVTILISHCYTTGTFADNTKGYIIGDNSTINGFNMSSPNYILSENYSEAGSPGGSEGDWNMAHARTALQNSPSTEPGVGTDWISRGASQSFELFNMGYNPYSINNISGTSLVRTAAATVIAGSSSAAAIIADKSYTILAITGGDSGSYSTITINSSSGSISTTAETVPNTYTVYVYNTGSYNITTFTLTVNELTAAAAAAVACCARPMNLVNVDYNERTQFIAGNTMIADTSVRRAAYTSYTDLLHKKMAYAAKK